MDLPCGYVTIPMRHLIKKSRFFPATGNRQSTSGTTINNVGQNLNVWSASPTSNGNARNLNANSGNWNWNNNNRSNGFPVRPVLAITKSSTGLHHLFFFQR